MYGLGIGFAMHAAPAYLAEAAPARVRGLLIRCRPPGAWRAVGALEVERRVRVTILWLAGVQHCGRALVGEHESGPPRRGCRVPAPALVLGTRSSLRVRADSGGAAHSLKECFVVIGILAGYLASYLYAEQVLPGRACPPCLPRSRSREVCI